MIDRNTGGTMFVDGKEIGGITKFSINTDSIYGGYNPFANDIEMHWGHDPIQNINPKPYQIGYDPFSNEGFQFDYLQEDAYNISTYVVKGNFEFDIPFSEKTLKNIDDLIYQVIFNDPYTIINWKNGEKTLVKAQDGEHFDKEKGFAMAILKALGGNKGSFNNLFHKYCK